MYTSFEIRNFRGIKELKIDNLKRLNLIAGKNNVGKTALLEALFLHCGELNPELFNRVNALRGLDIVKLKKSSSPKESVWDSVFYNFNTSDPVSLVGTDEKNRERALDISIHLNKRLNIKENLPETDSSGNQMPASTAMNQYYPALLMKSTIPGKGTKTNEMVIWPGGVWLDRHYLPEKIAYFLASGQLVKQMDNADLLGELEINLKLDEIIPILKVIEPTISGLSTIAFGNTSVIHADIGVGKLIPLSLLGEGINRLLSIIIRIVNAENSCLFIDEIENGFHHSIHQKIWEIINLASEKYNVQIFATTHSLECIQAAHDSLKETDYNFTLIRLDTANGEIIPTYYDRELLEISLRKNFEVR